MFSNTTDAPKYIAGDRVLYWLRGADHPKMGVITRHGERDGQLVYDVECHDGNRHWGYESQFELADGPVDPKMQEWMRLRGALAKLCDASGLSPAEIAAVLMALQSSYVTRIAKETR